MSMDDTNDMARTERINAYVSGSMPPADRSQFEQDLAGDATLREAVELEQLFRSTLQREAELGFRDVVRDISAAMDKEERTSTSAIRIHGTRRWAWLAAAACMVGLLGIGLWQWSSGPPNEQLAMRYADASVPHLRDGTAELPYSGVAELDSALGLIRKGGFTDALRLIEAPSASAPEHACKRDWLRGLALLGTGRGPEAMANIDRVIAAQCYPEAGLAKELKAAR